MKFEITYTEEDYLTNTLFWVSKSKRAKRIKAQTVVLLVAFCLVVSLSSYLNDNYPMTVLLIVLAIAIAFFYPIYQRWFYKKHYLKFIKAGFKDKIGEACEIEFTNDLVCTRDHSGEAEMKLGEIEQIYETGDYYFIRFNTEESLILPKNRIPNHEFAEILNEMITRYHIEFIKELDWRWK